MVVVVGVETGVGVAAAAEAVTNDGTGDALLFTWVNPVGVLAAVIN